MKEKIEPQEKLAASFSLIILSKIVMNLYFLTISNHFNLIKGVCITVVAKGGGGKKISQTNISIV